MRLLLKISRFVFKKVDISNIYISFVSLGETKEKTKGIYIYIYFWNVNLFVHECVYIYIYIYIYILIITGVQASGVIIDRLLRQCQCSSIKWIERSTEYVLPRIQVYIYIYISGFDKRYLWKFLTTVSFEACSVLDHSCSWFFQYKNPLKKQE